MSVWFVIARYASFNPNAMGISFYFVWVNFWFLVDIQINHVIIGNFRSQRALWRLKISLRTSVSSCFYSVFSSIFTLSLCSPNLQWTNHHLECLVIGEKRRRNKDCSLAGTFLTCTAWEMLELFWAFRRVMLDLRCLGQPVRQNRVWLSGGRSLVTEPPLAWQQEHSVWAKVIV